MISRFFYVFLGCICLAVPEAYSANISVMQTNNDFTIISISGAIEDGDGRNFMDLSSAFENVVVSLNSPGGLVDEGLLIAEQIYSSRFHTYVADTSDCFSMCGIIWLAGERRYFDEDSFVGFHGAYTESEQGIYSVSGPGNAKLGAFLGKIEISNTALSYITNAKPSEFAFVNFNDAISLGFKPQPLSGLFLDNGFLDQVDPVFSVKISSYISLYTTACIDLLKQPPISLEAFYNFHFVRASEVLGASVANYEFNLALIAISELIKEKGQVLACVEAEKFIRNGNIPIGIYGPSFDCSVYTSGVHAAICSTSDLWAPDIIMNSIYWNVRDNNELVADAEAFFVRQRQWLLMRDGCGIDVVCIGELYAFRLREITR